MATSAPTFNGPLEIALPQRPVRSLWSDAWRRLRRNVMAMIGLSYLLFLSVVAIFAPLIAPHNPVQTDVRKAGTYRKAAWLPGPESATDRYVGRIRSAATRSVAMCSAAWCMARASR